MNVEEQKRLAAQPLAQDLVDPIHQDGGPGHVLRRQELMANTLCLNPREQLSSGQREEIDRVWRAYPHLNDDEFVKRNLAHWLA